MKLLTVMLIAAAAVVTAQECQETSLLSCFNSAVAPIKTACPAADTACICGKLRVEEPCFTTWCPGGAFPGNMDSFYTKSCKGGSPSTAASTASASVTTGGKATGTTSNGITAAPATKTGSGAQTTGAGERLVIPAIAGGVMAVVGGGVALL
ncbi:hypothetical protein GQ44DRAFT_779304 [Phaeosphaeriaceae sp. PMI808]|nr:hypothetical protein GQ44DRAFT_779304 [Phaeosphaeriaceae sp. PMI808]